MLRSLRTRILLVIAIVAVGTAAAVGLLSRRVTLSEFDRYVGANDAGRISRARAMLGEYVYKDAAWTDLAPLVSRVSDLEHVRVIAIDASGLTVAAAPVELTRAMFGFAISYWIAPVRSCEAPV